MKDTNKHSVILVVDDDEMVRVTLKALISSLGYTCLIADGGQQALSILQATSVDLVFTDVVMPEMDGLQLLAEINEKFPATDVIVATGFSERASYAEVIKAGAMDFIKKPVDQAELDAKLARAFRERDLIHRLEQLSLCDDLTSLYNRRAFDQRFSEEVDRANRQGYDVFLAIVDIDNFKDYNDTYGHSEGDKVLMELSVILKDCTRHNVDMCFRLGGDEFAVLLPGTNATQATEIVQRILLRYAESSFGSTTLSIGIIACKRDKDLELAEDEERMKKRADEAMYEAKHSGKNCVVCRI
ncbi:diguanylate cyclase [Desulfopila sp. IMCC35008]|uniref:GGDEF domain-containing protein n=1 Tax=Desulfopila sp. IMCC35008 TaxID=2653858 RepID=UPI0013D8798B|nr:diguanylate cyclase [Desulfopila sp. IMCC35008]